MRPLSVYRETSFAKGMNDRLAPEHLPAGYLADALNCYIKTDEIVKRTGYSLIGDDLGSVNCQGMKGVRFANGTKEIVAVFNGSIYKWTGSGSWALIASGASVLSTTADVEIVVANNAVYFFDGTSTVPKYNAAAISTVAAIPKGTGARWFHNILAVWGMSGTPNNIQLSALGDPEDFTTGIATTISINPNDGDYIVTAHEFNDELLVFKTMRTWSLSGYGTAALTVSNLNDRLPFGTFSPRSVVSLSGSKLAYLSIQGDVPRVRAVARSTFGVIVDGGVLSTDIETTMSGFNKSALSKVAGIFDGRNLWYAYPAGSSTINNMVIMLDSITNGWVRHSGINAAVWENFAIGNQSQLYFGESNADSKAYVMDTSTSDNGTAINFQIISRRYGGDMPEAKKKWKYLYVTAKETGNYDLTVDMAHDGFTYDNLGTLNLSGTGSIFDTIILDTSKLGSTDVKRKRFNIPKSRAFYAQFKMYDTSATSVVTIRDWETMFQPKNIREI